MYPYDVPNIEQIVGGATVGGILAAIVAFAVLAVLFYIALFYVYMAFVWMTIAKKSKYKYPWLAWVPVARWFLIPILAKKNWAWGFFILLPPVYGALLIWWSWVIFKKMNYPGPLALIILGMLPPLSAVGVVFALSAIAYMVVLGLVAWKDMPKKK